MLESSEKPERAQPSFMYPAGPSFDEATGWAVACVASAVAFILAIGFVIGLVVGLLF